MKTVPPSPDRQLCARISSIDSRYSYVEDGKILLIALEDVGVFVKWIFDHPERSTGINLEMATDQVSFDVTRAYEKVTGRKGVHRRISFEEYLPRAEPYPNAPANWANIDPNSPSTMTWRENFTAWWKFWGGGLGATRDMALMDEIHPGRIKSVEEWMRKVDYKGVKRGTVLKGVEDLLQRVKAKSPKISVPRRLFCTHTFAGALLEVFRRKVVLSLAQNETLPESTTPSPGPPSSGPRKTSTGLAIVECVAQPLRRVMVRCRYPVSRVRSRSYTTSRTVHDHGAIEAISKGVFGAPLIFSKTSSGQRAADKWSKWNENNSSNAYPGWLLRPLSFG